MKIRIYRLDEIAYRFGREALKAKAKGDKATIDMFAAGIVPDATRPAPSARPGSGAVSQLSLFDAGTASGSTPAATVHRRVARSHRRAAEAALTSGAGPGTLDLFAAHAHAATAHERAATHVEASTPGHEAHSHDVVAHTHAVLADPHTAVHATPGDLTHGGRLHSEFRIDKAGHQTRRWVAQHEAPKADEPAEAPPVAPADQHIERVADDHVAELAATNAKKDRAEDRAAAPAPSALHVSPGAPLVGQAMTLYAGRHTMKGHAIWTAKVTQKLPRDEFDALKPKAKALGGYYSTYFKGGAITGFVFTNEANALKFMGDHGGIGPQEAAQAEPAATSSDLPIPASDPVGTAAYLGALPTGARVDVHRPESTPRNQTLVKKADGLVDAAAPKGSEPESPEDVAEALAANMATIVDGPPAMPAQTGEPAPNPPPPPSDEVEKRPEAELRSDEPRTAVPEPLGAEADDAPATSWSDAQVLDAINVIAWDHPSEWTPGKRDNYRRLAIASLDVIKERAGVDWTQDHRGSLMASVRTGLRGVFRAQNVPPARWEGARERFVAWAQKTFPDGVPEATPAAGPEAADPSQGGRLTAQTIICRDGVARTYWIATDLADTVRKVKGIEQTAKVNDFDTFMLVLPKTMDDVAIDAIDAGQEWGTHYFDDPAVKAHINNAVGRQLWDAARPPAKEPEAKPTPEPTPTPAVTTHDVATGKTTWAGAVTPAPAAAGTRADTQADLDALPAHTVLVDRPSGDGRDPREWVKRPDGAGWSILIRGSGSAPDRHTSTPIPSGMLAGKLQAPGGAASPAPKPTPAAPRARESAMAKDATKGQRKDANETALEIIHAAANERRALTEKEQIAVAAYSGKGGIGDSLNQYFTRPDIARAMWGMLAAHGAPAGARVLEPACGSGVFIETAPEGATVTGVELDPEVALVAEALHGQNGHEIHAESLESYSVARLDSPGHEPFDVVIGNAPFCTRTGGGIRIHKPHIANADAYFLDTALDHAKPGGLVAMIVHKGIMSNAEHVDFRARLLARAEVVDAMRLPVEAFEHADTTVTSDIILLRRRPAEVEGALLAGGEPVAMALGTHDDDFVNGRWFDTRQAKVLGTTASDWRGSEIVQGTPADAIAGMVTQRANPPGAPGLTVDDVQKAAGGSEAIARALEKGRIVAARKPQAKGSTQVIAGVTYILTGDPVRWHRLEDVDDVGALLRHGDEALRRAGELAGALADYRAVIERGDLLVAKSRRRDLEKSLRAWVNEYGVPADYPELVEIAKRDGRMTHMMAAVKPDGVLSDMVLTDPVVQSNTERVDKADLQSVALHLATVEPGARIDPASIRSMWTGKASDAEITERLVESGQYLDVSAGGKHAVVFADDYLTGDLFALRDQERKTAETASGDDKQRAETRLAMVEERIKARWRSIDDVDAPITAGWIPDHVIEGYLNSDEGRKAAFGYHAEKIDGAVKVIREAGLMGLQVPIKETHHSTYGAPKTYTHVRTLWGTGSKYAVDPVVLKLINRTARGEEQREEGREVSAHFTRWLRGSPWRAEAEETYNRTFFGHAERRQSAEALEIGGLAKTVVGKDGVERKVELHGYQNEGIRWAASQRRGILAYDVGLGKTFTAIALARHMRETQGVRKPVVVVPKSVARNWLAEIEVLHPGARVLVIGESRTTDRKGKVTAKSDSAEVIAQKLADAAANDYDAVIVTQPAFERIPVRQETIAEHEDRDFWATRAKKLDDLGSKGADASAKLREKMRASYDKQRADLTFGHKKAVVHWEDLGCDLLMVDEAHGFKNLNAAQDRWGSNPKFLGGSGTSKKASDLEMKAATVRLRRQAGESDAEHAERKARGAGDGVFLLTATPTKNSPLELYNMLQYVSPDVWQDRGIRNAEEFLDRYCTFSQRSVLNKDGEIVDASCVTGFQNMHELRDIMATMLRLRTARDVGLKLPEVDERVHMVDMSPEQHAAYDSIRAEAERAARSNDENEKQGATFRAMDQMRKASMDLTLLDAEAHPDAWKTSPKYKACADNVAEGVKKRGGQIIFVDSNDSHERLAQLLVQRGIPRNRIGVLNADTAKDSETRYEVGQAFRDGELDVVIGNTGVMGEGVNLQDKTTDIHHLDLPWDPGTMQQRNGRGVRQGNKNDRIAVHTYLAKQSFDGFKYNTLRGKSGWMDKLLSGVETAANDFDETAVSDEERMIMLAADPDAARAAYEKTKSHAIEKHAAAARVRALRRVEKLQGMKASLAKLVPGTSAHADLAQKVEMELRAVRRDGSVPVAVRHALDHTQPIVANEAGHVFTFNAVVREPGADGDKAHRLWRVQEIDPATRKVKLARFAGESATSDTFTVDDIKGWATLDDPPDEDGERVRVVREGLTQTPKAMYGYRRRNPYGVMHGIPQGRAEAMRDEIHDAYKAAVSRESYGSVPVFEADGSITSVPCQDVGDRRLVLPFGEDRKKLAVALKHRGERPGDVGLGSAVNHAFGEYFDSTLKREAP